MSKTHCRRPIRADRRLTPTSKLPKQTLTTKNAGNLEVICGNTGHFLLSVSTRTPPSAVALAGNGGQPTILQPTNQNTPTSSCIRYVYFSLRPALPEILFLSLFGFRNILCIRSFLRQTIIVSTTPMTKNLLHQWPLYIKSTS